MSEEDKKKRKRRDTKPIEAKPSGVELGTTLRATAADERE